MRLGGPVSIALHIGLAIGGIAVMPAHVINAEPEPFIDIDLVTIADETNVIPVTETAEESEEPPEAAAEELPAQAAPPPPPPEVEEIPLPAETPPPPKKEEPPKKKEPEKPAKQDYESALKDILAAANSAPAPAKKEAEKPANLSGVQDAGVREGHGNRRENTATITAFIQQQIRDNGCWSDQEDLANADTMRAVIRVSFGRDGKFSTEPRLIEPARMPAQGPFLVYVTRAFNGLSKCNNIGFKVPAEYFRSNPPPYIDLEFTP